MYKHIGPGRQLAAKAHNVRRIGVRQNDIRQPYRIRFLLFVHKRSPLGAEFSFGRPDYIFVTVGYYYTTVRLHRQGFARKPF